jgi:hypothetical protein
MPGKGNARKVGRDAKKCQRYKAEGRKQRNKERRIAKEKRRQEKFQFRKEAKQLEHLKRLEVAGKLKEVV